MALMTAPTAASMLASMALLSVPEAAAKYPLSRTQIRRLVASGTVKGQKFGPAWAVDEPSLQRYLASNPRPGRPPKKP